MKSLADFLSELKRRRVYRVAAVYAGVAFIISEIVANTFEPLGIPDGFDTAVIVLLILGFPIVIGLAWAFDITDKGIVRTKEKAEAEATTRRPILSNWVLAFVAVLAIIVAVWGWWGRLREHQTDGDLPRIAVLLPSYSGDETRRESITHGVHGELISQLSTMSGLQPIGKTTMRYISEKASPLLEKAKEVNADYWVESNITLDEPLIRVTASLTDVVTERPVYNNNYNAEWSGILSLYNEIVRDIAAGIGATLTQSEEARLAETRSVNPEALEAYYQGLFYYNKNTGEAINRAIEYFEQAIEIEPNYAEAYAGLAASYLMQGTWGLQQPTEIYPLAKDAAIRALEIDSMLPDARTSLAHVRYLYEWDWEGAEEDFKRALAINPSNARAHSLYALFLGPMDRSEEALREIRLAQDLEPLILNYKAMEGLIHFFARDYDSGIDQCLKTLEMDSNFVSAHVYLLRNYHKMGMQEEAKAEFEKIRNLAGEAFSLSYIYAVVSSESEALEAISKLDEYSKQRYYTATNYAVLYASFGDMDRAFEWMEKAYDQRDSWLPFLKMGGLFDVLRDDPRFEDFLHRMNFPE